MAERKYTPADAQIGEEQKVFNLMMPNKEELAYVNPNVLTFAGYFFTQEVGNKLTADGFVLSAKLALRNLETSIDPKTGKPIEGILGIRLTRDSWHTTIVTQNVRQVRSWQH